MTYFPQRIVLSGGRGSVYVTSGSLSTSAQRRWNDLADKKFRENKLVWLAQPLSVLLRATLPSEGRRRGWSGAGQVQGGRLPQSRLL